MSQKYYSKYSGSDIDKAIEYALSMRNESGNTIVGSDVDNKADFNTLLDDNTYIAHYYINSYDDSYSPTKIELSVFHIDENTICQKYDYKGESVIRYYSIIDQSWSDWAFSKSILSVTENEEVTVSKPTLILRHVDTANLVN